MAKACKSNGSVARRVSGERVRNTWTTCPEHGDSGGGNPFAKVPVIPDDLAGSHDPASKVPAVLERFMSYQLVGGVTAYQGVDG